MIIFWICVLAYIPVGVLAARLMTPSIIRRNTYQVGDRTRLGTPEYWATPGFYHDKSGIYRKRVVREIWLAVFLWPVLSWVSAINASLDKQMDRADPAVHAKQAARIAELERELDLQ